MMKAGSILIESNAPCPRCFHLENAPGLNDWMVMTHHLSSRELEKELSSAGWTFFYMANAIRTTVFGFNPAEILDRALKRLFRQVRQQRCNCLEIDAVASRSLFGMRKVSISAHPRRIQKGMVFSGQ